MRQPVPIASIEPALRAELERQRNDGDLVGAQYIALTATETQIDLQVGIADAATSRPMERATQQMAYSISKAITAIATLRLADSGALLLDRPLSHYFSAHPYGDSVSLRQLLAHTAGVPSPAPLSWFFVEGEPLSREQRLHDLLRASPALRSPSGARYRYSNLGYWLLEEAIQKAAEMDFAEYIKTQIFDPLGVVDAVGFEPAAASDLAVGHTPRYRAMGLLLRALTSNRYWIEPAGRWNRAARVVPFGRAYGGLFCSAAVLAPVLADLLRPQSRLLSSAARDALFAEQHTTSGRPTGSTLGWVCGKLGSARYVGKQGGGLGFHGNVRIYRDLGVATVLLGNVTEVSAGRIDRRSDALDRHVLGSLSRPARI